MPRSTTRCRSCGARGLMVFYEQRGLPLNSRVLLSSRAEALDYPLGDVLLGFCARCGFIANLLYQDESFDYAPGQPSGGSSAERQHTEWLADELIERYKLRSKTILWVGCSDDALLGLLSQKDANAGIGIDWASPALPWSSLPLHYLRNRYDERYAGIEADFFCSRHTLDCIGQVHDFVELVRRFFGAERERVALFEVADVRRLLIELAFWDLTYEQPSYFSAGSLARLFRDCDFDVFDLQRARDDESILIEVVASSDPREPHWEIEDDIAELSRLVADFRDHSASQLADWSRRLKRGGGRTVLWGAGSRAVSFLTALRPEESVGFVVDPEPSRQGRYVPGSGIEVVPPEFLREYRPAVVVATEASQLEDIEEVLKALGLEPALTAL